MGVDVESLYRRYGPLVLRRCRRLLRDEEAAVDAMHDVFVQLLRRNSALDERAPSALLQRVATNVCLNRLRTFRRHPEDREEELLHQLACLDEGPDSLLAVRSALERVFGQEPESTRVMAVLHLVDGMTLEEISAEVGLSVSGIRKRLRTLKARVATLEEARP